MNPYEIQLTKRNLELEGEVKAATGREKLWQGRSNVMREEMQKAQAENERLGSALYRIQCDRCSQPVGGYIETPEDGPLGSIIVPARFCPPCAAGRMPSNALAPEGEAEPPRWYESMRTFSPDACWRYLAENTVCIRNRGHDGGEHEPSNALAPEGEG